MTKSSTLFRPQTVVDLDAAAVALRVFFERCGAEASWLKSPFPPEIVDGADKGMAVSSIGVDRGPEILGFAEDLVLTWKKLLNDLPEGHLFYDEAQILYIFALGALDLVKRDLKHPLIASRKGE